MGFPEKNRPVEPDHLPAEKSNKSELILLSDINPG
jgi:hypothetical protein